MAKTTIDWTDYSWNPVAGCTPISSACDHCYARSIATRFTGTPSWPNGFKVTCHPERLEQPLHWRKPGRVFLCSAGDLFHEDVPEAFIARVFARMAAYRQHTFQILTKRPERMLGIVNLACRAVPEHWPLPNVWLGVTAENQEMADARIPILLQVPAAVRFVSIEPMLSAVDLRPWIWKADNIVHDEPEWEGDIVEQHAALSWVICGGETGPGARPMNPDWVRGLRDQCQAAGVPLFFKQMGEFEDCGPAWGSASGSAQDLDGCMFVDPDGTVHRVREESVGEACAMRRVGKKLAGHLLDGVEHRQFPEVAA